MASKSLNAETSVVVEAFDQLNSFENTVKINVRGTEYAVGMSDDRDAYRLYDPTEGYRYVGTLCRDRVGLDDHKIRFHPVDDDESIVVYNLNVNEDPRTAYLDEHLTEIRNLLTTESIDYNEDRPRSTMQDEIDGFNSLADFATSEYDGQLQLVVQHLSRPEVSQALFKYNNNANDTLSLIDIGVTQRSDSDEETTPFAIRELLIQYHNHLKN